MPDAWQFQYVDDLLRVLTRMLTEPCLHIVLYQPEIPHNTGSVGRTCVAINAKLWLVRPLGFRVDNYYLRRAGLDYWQHLNWEVVDDWLALNERLRAGTRWYFSKNGRREYSGVDYRQGDTLVFGCESQGLPESMLQENASHTLRIPVEPKVRSLNLSNSVAVVCYEARRQWNASP